MFSEVLTISGQNGAIVGPGIIAWSWDDAYGKTDLRAAHGAFAADGIRALRCSVQREPQGSELHLHGPVPLHGVRPAHVSRESAGHRSVPALAAREALPHGHSRSGIAPLANANATRDWRIYADFAQRLIGIARRLYINEPFGVDLANTAYALDSTTIDLSLSLFPWAPFRTTKAAVKMHTLLDLRGNIPSFIHISDGKLHDVNILDQLIPEAGAFYVMDRGYIDFQRLYRLHQAGSFFVTRAKRNMDAQRRYSRPTDRSTGVIFDQTLVLQGYQSAKDYPDTFRGIRYKDPETGKRLLFISNNTALPALSICSLYKARWQVELFFRWIKMHLRVKAFFGTSENAVKSQIWIAVSVYVLVAIIRKRLNLTRSLYEMLQILSLNLFEKNPLDIALSRIPINPESNQDGNQLILL